MLKGHLEEPGRYPENIPCHQGATPLQLQTLGVLLNHAHVTW